MAAPPAGTKNTRSGQARSQKKTKSGKKKKSVAAGPKSGGSAVDKNNGRARHHNPASSKSQRSRPGNKSASPSRAFQKRKTRKKAPVGSSGLRNWLLGLTLGLVLGCVGALFTFYWPQIKEVASYPATDTAGRQATPQPERDGGAPRPMVYEEENEIDPLVKKLDQILYMTLQRMGVSETDMAFLKVTRTHRGKDSWDHVLMQAGLPSETGLDQVVGNLKKAFSTTVSGKQPRLTSSPYREGVSVDVYLDGMHTHTLRLLPRVQTASLPPQPEAEPAPKPQIYGPGKPKVAIVIDDFGINRNLADCFMDLDMPITISVLPFLEHSKDIARSAHERGFEVMLHLPMQPQKWPNINPGPGVLLTSMDRNEIRGRVRAAIEAVPYAAAVNNHMGSKFTEDRERIGWALKEINQHGLAFLDSMTSNRSQAYNEARRLNLTTSYRNIFLDNVQDEQAIRLQLRKLVTKARQDGLAVGIGHVYPVTCQVLRNEYNQLKSKVDLVPFTRILENRE